MFRFFLFGLLFSFMVQSQDLKNKEPYILILGTIQDGGSPHISCNRNCCRGLTEYQKNNRKRTSLALIFPTLKKYFLFEATPDITNQMNQVEIKSGSFIEGVFITHAHIGHYSGLMFFGREAMGAKNIKVYAMPRLQNFLKDNGPWNQLIDQKNIVIKNLENRKLIELFKNVKILPFKVPHRDEFSETVGYKIIGPNKTLLFIPDIDKWTKWEINIVEIIKEVDYALIDATFYDESEINYRSISEIPHPFVIESMEMLKKISPNDRNKIHFIHMNHTNPLLNNKSKESQIVIDEGYNISVKGDVFDL